MNDPMEKVVFAAGLLHFCQAPAMVMAPRMLGWKQELERMAPINRRIVQVLGVSMMLVVLGLGIVVMTSARELVGGGRLALGLSGFLGVLWLFRGSVQVLLYRRIWPRGRLGALSHYALSLLFFALAGAYFAAFWINLGR